VAASSEPGLDGDPVERRTKRGAVPVVLGQRVDQRAAGCAGCPGQERERLGRRAAARRVGSRR
jgi:hypothetical protein